MVYLHVGQTVSLGLPGHSKQACPMTLSIELVTGVISRSHLGQVGVIG